MAQITLRLSDDMLEKVQQLADETNLTVTDYLLSKAVPGYIDEILTVDKILDKLDSISKNDTFSLKSLYPIDIWESFTTGSRISTGRLFYQSYEKNLYNLKNRIEFLGKNSANLAIYKKLQIINQNKD